MRSEISERLPREGSHREIGLVVIGLLIALFFRTYDLLNYPIHHHNDEMSCGIAAREFLHYPMPSLFSPGWLGHPHLGFFLTSLFLRIFGDSLYGLRMSSVVWGLSSLLIQYLFVRAFAGRRIASLAFILTIPFHWHVHFSRMGIHNMECTALSFAALCMFATGLARRSIGWVIGAGIAGGIAFQVYTSGWLLFPLFVFYGMLEFILQRNTPEERLSRRIIFLTLCSIICFFITVAPSLVTYWMTDPSSLLSRRNAILFGDPRFSGPGISIQDRFELLAHQLSLMIRFLFGATTDSSGQYSFSGYLFDPLTRIFLFIGFFICTGKIRETVPRFALVLSGATLVTGGLLTTDAPFSPRLLLSSLTLPIVAAYGFNWVLSFRRFFNRAKIIPIIFFLGTVSIIWFWNISFYVSTYPTQKPGNRFDSIIRKVDQIGKIHSIVNYAPEDPVFTHESYTFRLPDIQKINLQNVDIFHLPSALQALPKPIFLFASSSQEIEEVLSKIDGAHVVGCESLPVSSNSYCWTIISEKTR